MDREDALGAGRGGLNPVSLQYPQVCFVPLAPPGNTRGMVFRSVQSSGVITDAVNPLRVSVYSTEPRLQVRNSTLNVVNTT